MMIFKLALVEKGRHYVNQPTIYFPMTEKKMGFFVVAIVCKDTKIRNFSVKSQQIKHKGTTALI